MTTQFEQLFNTLVADRKVEVLITGTEAESLRTSLVRRWTRYKNYYAALGFLSDDDAESVLSAAKVELDGVTGTRYSLRKKARRNSYVLISTASIASTDQLDT